MDPDAVTRQLQNGAHLQIQRPGAVNLILDSFLKSFLILVQLAVIQVERYARFVLYHYHRVISLWTEHYREQLRQLKNIPTNIAIGINHAELDLDMLAKLIDWCRLVPTIKSVTIYHPYAEEENPIELKRILPDQLEASFEVCILSAHSGRQSLIEAARHFASASAKPVTIDGISEYLKRDYPYADPDLLLLFGDCQIYNGFPCWQIRLTETIFFAPLEWITLSQFHQALKIYSKCEQRFGK